MIWNDMFAGGGGTSSGLHNIKGIKVAAALNHWQNAIKTHMVNFKDTKHYWADVYDIDEHTLPKCDGFWASIDCTDHSNAKGGQPKDAGSYMLADELPRFISHCDPSIIVIENVREFLKWGPLCEGKRVSGAEGSYFWKWVKTIKAMGYPNFDYKILNVADYGGYTSRRRLIIMFTKESVGITWPKQTHHKEAVNGYSKWNACKDKINLDNEGESIFGRQYNEKLAKHVRRELSPNTKRRIAGGIKKFAPEFMQFIMSYYGTGDNVSSINKPCPVITTKDRHTLITVKKKEEKIQFITDYIWGVQLEDINNPLKVITTRESKHLITVKRNHFLSKYNGNAKDRKNKQDHASSVDNPFPTILTVNKTPMITTNFVSDGTFSCESKNISVDVPLNTITTQQRHQFISAFFNSGGKPESNNHSIDGPLNAITTVNKSAMATLLQKEDWDIKMRFLSYEELSAITGFPDDYNWYGSKKDIIRMIGNAVPPLLAEVVGKECITNFNNHGNKLS